MDTLDDLDDLEYRDSEDIMDTLDHLAHMDHLGQLGRGGTGVRQVLGEIKVSVGIGNAEDSRERREIQRTLRVSRNRSYKFLIMIVDYFSLITLNENKKDLLMENIIIIRLSTASFLLWLCNCNMADVGKFITGN